MTELSKTYSPSEIEEKWYRYWMEHQFFSSSPNPSKEKFSVVIPPPNVTGVLHMGHMLNNTIQDVLVRRARMQGKEACWVPGTDHASIATEAKVVALLREKGIKKSDISREAFLAHAWDWKEKYGGIILSQLKKLGASVDWNRTRFTMEDSLSESVLKVFVDMYQKGYIYRGLRMVNWDPQGKTALSDEEVIYKEVNSKLYHLRYLIVDGNKPETTTAKSNYLTIATTRPETILGDTAICVHPEDERYQHLIGKHVLVPIIERMIPIIADEYVEKDFGTGCLKVTPAHDINDHELGKKHNLVTIDIMHDDGLFNFRALHFEGKDRFEVRKEIVRYLENLGHLAKVEEIKNNVGYSERTNAVIEPRLSKQWFVDMKKFMKANPEVLDAVMQDEIRIYPEKFKNTYRHWIDNIKDWCISRQLWWGHQIPAWYAPNGDFAVAESEEQAYQQLLAKNPGLQRSELRRDEDVLDTWYSSWLWPITVFDGLTKPDNPDIKYYYPTDVLVTAPEILFFWVARMIMAGYEYQKKLPFKDVYLHGIVRDKEGRKMSKSLGNSPDPIDLMNKYSTDGVRFGMLVSAPAGNDILYDDKYCEQGRNFNNKLWNALRLIKGWKQDTSLAPSDAQQQAIAWFGNRLNQVAVDLETQFADYRLSEALMSVYKLIWDDFCASYLEMIKPGFEQPIDAHTYEITLSYFETMVTLLHPFMPFITEEIWMSLKERTKGESICVAAWPHAGAFNDKLITNGFRALEVVTEIRNYRQSKQLSPKGPLVLSVHAQDLGPYIQFSSVIQKLANLSALHPGQKPETPVTFVLQSDEFYIPAPESVDTEKEIENLQKELEYIKGFLKSVNAKLSNEKFVSGAPAAVVDMEKKKKADAESKIITLEQSLESLLKN
ncbi:MAG: valine--tRNA ligase [Cytophagaceae bacterium]|nr:valine--tRNA ligase [Cytophagaceae bacterium]